MADKNIENEKLAASDVTAEVAEDTAADAPEDTDADVVKDKKAGAEAADEIKKGVDADENNANDAEKKKPADEKENKKASENVTDVTGIEKAIIRQVEYYFSDSNLNRDAFMRAQLEKNEEHWVPFSVLTTFKRLANLSTDVETIVNALAKSDAALLEISEDKQSVRRHPDCPLPEFNKELRKELVSRTAYAKGFPLDSTIDDMIAYFSGFEGYVNVTMRKYFDKPTSTYKFKGSVFATFKTVEDAKAFISAEKQVYKESTLLRKWQADYIEEKREENQQKLEKKASKRPSKEEPEIVLPKNAVVMFKGGAAATTREKIREEIEKFCDDAEIAYLEYSKGEDAGYVRFANEGDANKLMDKFKESEPKLILGEGEELTVSKIDGEEEDTYLKKCVEAMTQRRKQFTQKKGRFIRGQKRNNHFNRRRNDN